MENTHKSFRVVPLVDFDPVGMFSVDWGGGGRKWAPKTTLTSLILNVLYILIDAVRH